MQRVPMRSLISVDHCATINMVEDRKGLLKAELKRRTVTYNKLVEKLAEIGVKETEVNIRNKIARGRFTTAFLVQCLEAIGARHLRLGD
jgi:hypothetical protein